MTTIREALAEGAREIEDSDPQNNRRAARILLAHVLGASKERLIARPDDEITDHQQGMYLELISRRARGEPLQYLTGHQEFYGLDFLVSPDVLIPRPETEFLVEQVLELAGRAGSQWDDSGSSEAAMEALQSSAAPVGTPKPVIVDIGTGSGCVAISLAVHLRIHRIIATDISEPALDVARQNAERHGVGNRIEFVSGDLLGALQQHGLERGVDFIACNPPYVPSSRPEWVQREVREFEPATALYGGPDGLDFFRRLLVDAPGYVKADGYLVCEIGYSQLDSVRAMADSALWEVLAVAEDLQGIPRTLTLKKR